MTYGEGNCFNPHRPMKAGAANTKVVPTGGLPVFQSSPADEGRCCLAIAEGDEAIRNMFQSSPADEGRCCMA